MLERIGNAGAHQILQTLKDGPPSLAAEDARAALERLARRASIRLAAPTRRPAPRRDAFGDPLPEGAVARIGTIRLRHAGAVRALAFSPDDTVLASGAKEDDAVRLWDMATGRLLRVYRGHQHGVTAIAFAPTGKRLVSAGGSGEVLLWDLVTGRKIEILADSGGEVAAAAFSPDGRCVRTVGAGGWVRAWDLPRAGHPAYEIRTDAFSRPASSGDGTLVAAAHDGIARIWDTASGKLLLQLPRHKHRIDGIAFSADGRYLATSERDAVRIWELATCGLVLTLAAADQIFLASQHLLAFAPDGRSLVTGDGYRPLHVWDLRTGKEQRRLRSCGYALDLAFSHDGKTLATASPEGLAHVCNFASGKDKFIAARIPGGLKPLGFLPDGKRLAVGWDAGLAFWEIARPKRAGDNWRAREIRRLNMDGSPLALSSDGKRAFVHQSFRRGLLWDVAKGVQRQVVEGPLLTQALFTPDGKTLAVAKAGQPTLWDASTGKRIRRIGWQQGIEVAITLSPDGKRLATANESQDKVRVWETATGKELPAITLPGELPQSGGRYTLAFSPDGRSLAVADRDGLRLLDVAARRLVRTFRTEGTFAFAPDGKTLATAGPDGTILFWEVATGKARGTLRGHAGVVNALCYSPDGRLLASGSSDHTVLIWDLSKR